MVFSSITFLFYFLPAVLCVYFLLSFSWRLQNVWLLASSLFFYAWGEPVCVLLLLLSIAADWLFGIWIDRAGSRKKMVLWFGCLFHLGMLGFFKYTGFLAEIVNSMLGAEVLDMPEIRLPIGISFYTFQALSYLVDVYRGKAKVQKNLLWMGLYISFFPQLVAGPIVRYTTMQKQIVGRKTDWGMVSAGLCRFAEGLLKKILLANHLAQVADNIFGLTVGGATDVPLPVMLSWVGAIAYTLQLYYDFSSYSDMAIGLGMVFGFTFPENFRYPFTSRSVKEFMVRWHISLAAWFGEYVYKPLGGGSGENQDRMIRNLFIVWLLTGIWHGAAWNFIWWGLCFALLITLENLIRIEEIEGHGMFRRSYTLFAVVITMVIFRCENIPQLSVYMADLFNLSGNGFYSAQAVMYLKEYAPVFLAAILCTLPLRKYVEPRMEGFSGQRFVRKAYHFCYVAGMLALFVFCIAVLAKGAYNPFIYFNF